MANGREPTITQATGSIEKMRHLIESGAFVDSTDRAGRTALMYACADGKIDAAKYLIYQGSSVNAQDNAGFCPLHFASQSNHVDCAKLLIESGAIIDAVDKTNRTPLWLAAMHMYDGPELVKLLFSRGANPDIVNHSGVSPRTLAKYRGFDFI